jgi:hypothetical protein
MSEALDGLGQVRLLVARAVSAKHKRRCQNHAQATAHLAQSVGCKALNLVVVGSSPTVDVFHSYVQFATTKCMGKAYWRNPTAGECVFIFALAFCVINEEGRR